VKKTANIFFLIRSASLVLVAAQSLNEQTLNSAYTRTETATHLLWQFHQKHWVEAFGGSEAGVLPLRLSGLFERDSVDVRPIFSRLFSIPTRA
jgi:hypothetical protein